MASRQSITHAAKAMAVESRPRWVGLALGVGLIAATFVAYFPAIRAGYIWDDDSRVYDNPLLRSLDGLWESWTSTKLPDYWPLTRTVFWIEWQLWGNNPHAFHLVSIVLHGLAAVSLWRVLKRLGIGGLGAFVAGLLFAVHPVTVESVAWITEQKNLLSMVFYLLSIYSYLRFDDRSGRLWYLSAFALAVAALLAKSAIVALPIVLLICVWWRRGRIARDDLLRTAPFFAMSLILGLIELWFEQHNCIVGDVVRPEGIASRIASVGWVAWFYLYKLVLPINLTVAYPRWDIDGGRAVSFIPLALLLACFTVLWYYRKGWCRGPLVALESFVIVLSPVLGLLTMAYARHSLVADHLQYPGMPGIMALIGAGIGVAWTRAQRKNMRGLSVGVAALTGVITLALAALTWQHTHIYKDSMSLWTHAIRHNDRAWMAYYNRGILYSAMHDPARAIQDYTRTIELKPNYAQAYNNRGVAYGDLRDYDQEIRDCSKAVELKPDHAKAYANRGLAYGMKGNHAQAISDFAKSIALMPNDAPTYKNRGLTYGQMGDDARAIQDFNKAIELDAGYVQAYHDRATAFLFLKEYDKAWADVKKFRQLGGTPSPAMIADLAKASGRTE